MLEMTRCDCGRNCIHEKRWDRERAKGHLVRGRRTAAPLKSNADNTAPRPASSLPADTCFTRR